MSPARPHTKYAYVEPAEGGIPGLFNVVTADGRHFIDLTVGQFGFLIQREGWQVVQGPPPGANGRHLP